MSAEFLSAIQSGDLKLITEMVSENQTLVNTIFDDENKTPLELALVKGFTKIVDYLISVDGFDVNHDEHHPLRLAVDLGFIELAKTLLELGANPNYRPEKTSSALLLCLENEYLDLASLMVEKGAEVNIRNENGWTPLIWASIKGRKSAVDFLIKHNAHIHVCNNDGWNAITGAYFKKHLDIVSLLKEKGAVFSAKYSEAALLSAYQNGYVPLATELLESGVSANIKDNHNRDLLYLAIERGDAEFAKKLIDKGVDLDNGNEKVGGALRNAIQNNQMEIVIELINCGVNINLRSDEGWLYTHLALKKGNEELLFLLIDKGIAIDAITKNKQFTVLMLAAQNQDLPLVKSLIEKGANHQLKNSDGKTAKDLSFTYQGNPTFSYLRNL